MKTFEDMVKIVQEELTEFKGRKIKVKLSTEDFMSDGESKPLSGVIQSGIEDIHSGISIRTKRTYDITLCINERHALGPDHFKHHYNYRFHEFMESVGVPISDISHALMILLHEYGHIHYYDFSTSLDSEREFYLIDTINHVMADHLFPPKVIQDLLEDEEINVVYLTDISELNADLFAIKKFIPIWNKIKRLGNEPENLGWFRAYDRPE
jgi:hypothetical protein